MTVVKDLQKHHGETAVFTGDRFPKMAVKTISTGSLALDLATGIGGVPRGRIVEIFGDESSGKSTLAFHIIAQAQKLGGNAVYMDAECSLDASWSTKIGVDIDSLIISQPESGEQAFQMIDTLVRSGDVDVIVIDSIPALIPAVLLETDIGDQQVGAQARMMTDAIQRISPILFKTNTILVMINQLRDNIAKGYGPSERTPGGRALKYYTSMRISLSRSKLITDKNGEAIGMNVKARVVKNKLARPHREANLILDFQRGGFSRVAELLDFALQLDILKQNGAYYYYGEQKIAHGQQNAVELLYADSKLADELERKIRQQLDLPL